MPPRILGFQSLGTLNGMHAVCVAGREQRLSIGLEDGMLIRYHSLSTVGNEESAGSASSHSNSRSPNDEAREENIC